ncbi:hypothetical protein ABB37_07804 [Leptomonas pyrrhocoris]|uniref:U-box domain-containing protein n=1 Tax=Leptomonas pyrrhocoris TaxID=157538 RepID=A0A0N0VDU0_LEPPY|nr:hypothetical protein ABB37_07804 [Leptomonas pyrrhocoris]XP_015654941.1 hypothetical protein ABB37_07804 [Leptomonas pyrrhocoris]KPA76501.1 hypothetical protein ABB37_07804 [Leptomonas pyrrhocoris]KPA76502.1 hypothetical protein ABB37_07804 [Leptomonas pyrrhocoris]|eukprot:XP_015654940.1 hypothetical protein ABB37_07804 [Leptomonas pyrrhocoris]
MSLHPAIKALVEQPIDAIGLTAVSSVASALEDVAVASDLIQRPEHSKALNAVLKKTMSILNNRTKNFALRLACLECLYRLSQPSISSFRTGLLCNTVNDMDKSVEEMLSRTGPNAAATEALASAWEMFTVLVFRFSDYNTSVCRLLLQHTSDGDVGTMVQTLLRVVVQHRDRCEWPLLLAALQTLYGLTVSSTYYTAEDGAEAPPQGRRGSQILTFTVESFQDKIAVLLATLRDQRVLEQLFASLRLSWHDSTHNRSPAALAQGCAESMALGALGRPDVAHTVTTVTKEQQMELLNWLSALKLVCRAVHNMVEFSRDPKVANELRTRLLSDPGSHDFLAAALVPAVTAAIQTWSIDVAALQTRSDAFASSASVKHSLLMAGVGLLRFVRFTLYKPTVGFTPAFLTSMERLTQQIQREEPRLRTQYAGMQLMLLTVECLANMNATAITTPVNLADVYQSLLATISADKTYCSLSNSYHDGTGAAEGQVAASASAPSTRTMMTVAEWFILCLREEESPFCEAGTLDTGNASVQLLHRFFSAEEAVLQETEERVAELVALESQLETLQNFLLLMTLTELLNGMPDTGLERLTRQGASGGSATNGRETPATTTPSRKSKPKRKKGANHPAEFVCDLTGKLMREPVVLKNGHRFECDALQNVIDQVGHVDPISGEAIDEAVEVDEGLQQQIAAYRVQLAANRKV